MTGKGNVVCIVKLSISVRLLYLMFSVENIIEIYGLLEIKSIETYTLFTRIHQLYIDLMRTEEINENYL